MEECEYNNGNYEVITVSHFDGRHDDVFTTSSLEEAKCERDRLIDMADEYNYESVKIVQVVSHHWRDDDEEL
jgi:hypothetical protein